MTPLGRAVTAGEIGNIGERHVAAWLEQSGYRCNRNTRLPGSTDIEAIGSNVELLVQVKTALTPNPAPSLSSDERRNLIARASRTGRQAWLAQLQINRQGARVGDVVWTKLN